MSEWSMLVVMVIVIVMVGTLVVWKSLLLRSGCCAWLASASARRRIGAWSGQRLVCSCLSRKTGTRWSVGDVRETGIGAERPGAATCEGEFRIEEVYYV